MSITPQALERSVLERKERDELAAIAEAMGVKASSRASKSTLIDHILREAGIETPEERPKRIRRTAASAGADNGAGASKGIASEASTDAAADAEATSELDVTASRQATA